MAPTRVDQATIIILDIGRNVATSTEKNEKTFFDNARECTIRILERKIISQPKNYIGIILLGTKVTKNNMADQCDGVFRHIEMFKELQSPTWQMIRDLPDAPSKSGGDWFDALIVAADHFKNGISGVKMCNKKIILITNFEADPEIDDEQVKQALDGFKEENIEVDVIGPDIESETKNENIELARLFVQETNGATATFNFTMRYLNFHRKKATNSMPWNVDLSIGPNVKIPVSSYIRVRDEPVIKNWKKEIKDPVTSTGSTTEGIVRSKEYIDTETQTSKNAENIKDAYQYGQQFVPIDNCDKSMFYQSGLKCLSVYGFTHASNVKWQNLNGDDGLSYVFGRKGDKKAQQTVRCLVECLLELDLVGIVRRVYNTNNAPKMYVLMPVIDTNANFVCLSMIGINYKEDIKNMAFPQTNLKKYNCTNEQVNAFKDLINAMDLTKAYDETYDDTEAFPIAETVSPNAQYILDCIALRALNPGKPLPQPRDDIMMLFTVPPLIEKQSREPLDKVKALFELKKVEVKQRRKKNMGNEALDQTSHGEDDTIFDHDIPKIQLPTNKIEEVDRIGTLDPISDFKHLINAGKTLADLSPEMTEVLEAIIYCNLDGNYSKALDTMFFFRAECVKGDPAHYNNWLQKLKMELTERSKTEFQNKIDENKLNFIFKDENNLSTFETEDSQLYENDTMPNSTELVIKSDVNDMFDEM